MSFKTLKLLNRYNRLIREQGEDAPPMDQEAPVDGSMGADEGADATMPPTEDSGPVTSNAENQEIEKILDAALFKPSDQQKKQLSDIQLLIKSNAHKNIVRPIMFKVAEIIGSPFKPLTEKDPEGEIAPLMPEKENAFVSNFVNAALYEPSAEEENTLIKLKEVMELGRFTNAREEILTPLLSYINSSNTASDLVKQINDLD